LKTQKREGKGRICGFLSPFPYQAIYTKEEWLKKKKSMPESSVPDNDHLLSNKKE